MELKIGNLIAKLPIIQGGMGVGVSLSNLAGNVAKYGAIGVISAAHPGYLEKDFEKNTLQANIRALKNHIRKAKEISNNGIIGVNIMVAMKNYKELVQASIEGGADLIISGAGLPLKLPEYTKNSEIKILPIVSSSKATRLILSYWKKHYNRIADGIIVEGPEAGGHLGFKADGIENDINKFESNVKDILKTVKDLEREYSKEIPVIVAGGVFDSNDIKRYMELGANGVQIGSRFVTTYECDVDMKFKEAYLNCNKSDIKIVKSPVGMPGRAINNNFLRRINNESNKISKCYNCLVPCNPSTTPYCISEALINAARGDIDNGLIFCGANAYRINKMMSVKELLDELII
ncbi:nitronate monooxygenase family protein [Clostridium sp.]|uniref:NAD(P)H-dependent flavin oxidoreductase n=1 Tax=Clostridium sp. TaxID=1506 RepID=UPI001B7712A3|nr:nitronate monooxygenase family protein [Clostridium sp.]MBP3915199.1 nitronate monooxygenase [Clostridium sp.]MEE0933433.1 nitronate monooxygenase family protein [Clostridium sp.]